jgi:D-alanyl-D-alanine endopeptidase (penicillin-binding protein 7)
MRCRQELLLLGLAVTAAGSVALAAAWPREPASWDVYDVKEPPSGAAAAYSVRAMPAAVPAAVALPLRSHAVLVEEARTGTVLYARHADEPRPIASLTKLMTVLVVLESGLPLDEPIEITPADRDRLKGTRSRLSFGTVVTRRDLIAAALAASDNRAAAALARRYPGGREAFVAAMNAKARALGLTHTRFTDPTGLDEGNVSTARELARLVAAAAEWNLIETLSTQVQPTLTDLATGRSIALRNTNRLVYAEDWDIALSKTGYTARAGHCLAMRATVAGRPLTIVLLDSWGKLSKYGDAQRIRRWLGGDTPQMALLSRGGSGPH